MDSKFLRAEELGVRLEIVQGLPIWEPSPVYKHQRAVDRIRAIIARFRGRRGYEAKDLEIGPQFYLSQGVKDVVVFNPYTLAVRHVRRDGAVRHISPVEIQLLCGGRCTV